MGIVSSVTDEEDDLPSGQHTMCFITNMWTSEGSTQPNRKPESTNFNQFFSGIHLTSTRHLVCFYHVTFVCSLNLFLLIFRLSSPVVYINYLNKLEWIDFLSFHWVSHGNHSVRGRSTDEDQGSFLTPIILECSYCYTDEGRAQA